MIRFEKKLVTATILMGSVMAANILNLIFNIFLGRTISAGEFGVILLVTNFLYIASMVLNALSSTINREVSIHIKNEQFGIKFIRSIYLSVLKVTVVFAIVWLLCSRLIANFFHVPNIEVFVLFVPVILLFPYIICARGFFQGRFSFFVAATLILIEPIIKLICAGVIILLGLHEYIYMSLYISLAVTGILAIILVLKIPPGNESINYKFPRQYFLNAILVAASSMAFLSIDVILAKHFLDPITAGHYALLSLIGKIIFFLGTLFNMFTVSIISKDIGNRKNPRVSFYLLFFGSFGLCLIGGFVFGILKDFTVPLLFSNKAGPILPYLNSYIAAMILFTLASIITSYHLVKKQYVFALVSILTTPLIIGGIVVFHANIREIVNVMLVTGILNFILLGVLHLKKDVFGAFNIDTLIEKEELNYR